jgi:L-ascorbate metabolism protein UlaG (beta-lactamase superfamily)
MADNINITYLGRACFKLEYKSFTIILDPYAPGSVPGLNPLSEKANLVLCSHEHHDHNYREGVELVPCSIPNPFKITELASFHDNSGGRNRGPNIIRIFEADGLKIIHYGDIGCFPASDQISLLSNADAVMIPVGGYYTVDAHEAVEIIKSTNPHIIIPMHYKVSSSAKDVISPLDDYLDICGRWVDMHTSSIVVGHENRSYTAVLTPKMKE